MPLCPIVKFETSSFSPGTLEAKNIKKLLEKLEQFFFVVTDFSHDFLESLEGKKIVTKKAEMYILKQKLNSNLLTYYLFGKENNSLQ